MAGEGESRHVQQGSSRFEPLISDFATIIIIIVIVSLFTELINAFSYLNSPKIPLK